jgi:hypothetical protein
MTVSQSTPGSDPDKLETCGLGQALLWLAKRKPIVPEAAFYAISKASSLPRIKPLRESLIMAIVLGQAELICRMYAEGTPQDDDADWKALNAALRSTFAGEIDESYIRRKIRELRKLLKERGLVTPPHAG